MPDDVAEEKVKALQSLGADVERVRPASIVDKKQVSFHFPSSRKHVCWYYARQYVVRRFLYFTKSLLIFNPPRISQDWEQVNLENLKQMASTKLQLALTAFIHTFLNRHHHLFWSQQLQVPIMLNLTRTNGLIAAIYSHREGTLLTSSRLVISIRVFVTLFYTHTHIYIRTEVTLRLIMEERVQKYGGRLMVI